MKEVKEKFEGTLISEFDYLLHIPPNYEAESRQYPLIIFFHGGGERGDEIDNIKKYGIYPFLHQIYQPYIILSMQCKANRMWDSHFGELTALVGKVCGDYRVNQEKVISMGFSLGGFGAVHFGIYSNQLVKGIVSIAGGTFLRSSLPRLANTSILLIHGENDDRVNIGQSEMIFEALKESNNDISFIRDPDAGHELCTSIFGESTIFDWLAERFS